MSGLSFLSHHHLPKGTSPLQVKHTLLPSVTLTLAVTTLISEQRTDASPSVTLSWLDNLVEFHPSHSCHLPSNIERDFYGLARPETGKPCPRSTDLSIDPPPTRSDSRGGRDGKIPAITFL